MGTLATSGSVCSDKEDNNVNFVFPWLLSLLAVVSKISRQLVPLRAVGTLCSPGRKDPMVRPHAVFCELRVLLLLGADVQEMWGWLSAPIVPL